MLQYAHGSEINALPAHVGPANTLGIKWVSTVMDNPKHHLPAVMATIILNDPETGFPICLMSGRQITAYRTAAVSAVAAKHLANPASRTVGLIGAGVEARTHLMALKEVLPLETVRVYDVIKGASEKLAVEMEERLGLHVLAVDSSEKAVRGSDVVVTVTTSSERFLDADWLSEGSFVAAVGGQEIKLNVIRRSTKLVVEHLDTCRFDGNISEFFSTGQVTETDIYAELAEIVSGKKAGRQLDREINTFISAGLAMNDIVTANAVFQLAREKKIGLEVSF